MGMQIQAGLDRYKEVEESSTLPSGRSSPPPVVVLQVEDVLPPVFSVTPKGSGAGYGVGFDLDDLLSQSLTDLQHSDPRER